ncbi:multidrug efflux SMR transporter [Rossellomorea vietnamensis]|uniref:Multidrug efflux SMR transporter n=2 Tax=Rossellomorea TaxID=2837508 RepID=A0A5D4KK55_9BACI|nr:MULTISPECIES: multidrug efflux SMR transporter [Rossellomorea]TYR77279.1 multidrug efflux SMR transporter [Rossellomorea vietnamensis]TYS78113.1 multidrug efflux SMR transporter [Rossellomorea aquimaris]
MAWIYLITAGIFDVLLVTFMKLSEGYKKVLPPILAFVSGGASFYLLSLALISIPISTGYSVWTGIRSAGAVITRMVFLSESRDLKRIFFISCIDISVIGLKAFS